MANLESVIERQHQLFGVISRAVDNLKKLGPSKTNRGNVQSRMEALKANWEKFQNNHESLFKSCSSEQRKLPYFKDDLYSTCEEEFIEAHCSFLNTLDSLEPVAHHTTPSTDLSVNSSVTSSSRRLPRIDLPKFSGDYSQWSHFRDLFVSMIVENSELSAVEKLHYLKMSLSGEPSQHLKNIAVSGENFARAWDTLVSRYENKRILIDAQLSSLFATRKIKSDSSAEVKRLFGDVKEALGALEALDCPVRHWDLIIIFMMTRKLDSESLRKWEETLGAQSTPPSFADFETFLVSRIHTLEALERSLPQKQQASGTSSSRTSAGVRSFTTATSQQKCALCDSKHYISLCPKYLEKTLEQRQEIVKSKNLCFNCLGPHQVKACRNVKRCRTCRKQHHTTLHPAFSVLTSSATASASTAQPSSSLLNNDTGAFTSQSNSDLARSEPVSHCAYSGIVRRTPSVLLATALVTLRSRHGEISHVRALLDQGSEVSFISESAAQSLKLPRRAATIPVLGIGAQRSTVSNGVVSLNLVSRINSAISLHLDALVLPKLTTYLPPAQVERALWPHIQGLPLADPTFATPSKIDMILGADVYAQVLEDGLCRGKDGDPIAQKTSLGWILSGTLSDDNLKTSASNNLSVTGLQCCLDSELLTLLQRFWTQEEILPSSQPTMTPEESQCEEHFKSTHSRDPQGRFVVRLPFKENAPEKFGDSRSPALKSLLRMETRFNSNAALKSSYNAFLREYRELDHMRLLIQPNCSPREFFLPHHGVIREVSSTTKLRVVFNGSQKTNLGLSLNDTLHIGPKLQTDLAEILLRWRRHQYVFAADIEKMYRQIRVHEEDWPSQKILWRDSQQEDVQEYYLCTVTYGLACAPYLALRCLHQLTLEAETHQTLAVDIIRRDTYVDDILSGAATLSEAQEQIRQLNEVLTAGGFTLRKWIANDSDILANIPPPYYESSAKLQVEDRTIHHTLGIQWDQKSDSFGFSAPSSTASKLITKRSLLSFIAQIFDPLGWLAPIVITAKLLLQEIWAIRLDWDEELPKELQSRWSQFITQIEEVKTISIPRWFGTEPSALAVELHGFSDASQSALAAVIYIRVLSDLDDARVTLVSAKTKVAPLKRMTIPRLELSAAVLLVRQIRRLRDVLDLQQVSTHLWTDSTVALTWIKSHPSRWKDFVRNRVSFIQELSNSRWHHVSGKENPADLASRGVPPQLLKQQQLWWNGPQWLHNHSTSWPSFSPSSHPTDDLEERPRICSTANAHFGSNLWDLIDRYSSLTALLRTTAWLLRSRDRFRGLPVAHFHKTILTPAELESALHLWVRLTQQAYFSEELRILQSNKPLNSKSPLLRLTPILDDGLLRLRGRLHNSHLDFSVKHPLILPRDSRLTTLVIDHHHRRTLHGGSQLTLTSIRQKFWIIGGRSPIRSFIHRCVICCRHRAITGQQLMGQLPTSRVTPCRPFFHTGVDYAGPLILKTFRGRGAKTYKGYFIIFICLSTSAIHLELATDYTTEGFIAAYKRFSGRRGLCSTITSDCGTNLIGADLELAKLFKASSREWAHITNLLANDGVTWKFNPPSAPHFGGKWEAGVKSVKFHLRRIIGDTPLTYEELSTLLIQIEAILNSRPLSAVSDDPTDLTALTPGHFLIGSALSTIPEPSTKDLPSNRLSRLQLIRQMTESFWRRWSAEYLHHLQNSTKWHRKQDQFSKGALVILKDERFPPSKWPLARIIDLHPGADGLVRVVTIKTAATTLKRPIVKLCPLPSSITED